MHENRDVIVSHEGSVVVLFGEERSLGAVWCCLMVARLISKNRGHVLHEVESMSEKDGRDSVIGGLSIAASIAIDALCRGLRNLAPTHLLSLQVLV